MAGQFSLEILGRILPGLIRFPGGWRPTATPDTGGYLAAAEQLPELEPHLTTKVLYLLLLRLDSALGLAGWGVIIMQFIALTITAIALRRFVAKRWGPAPGMLAAAVFVLNPHVAQWVKTLMTDSLFMTLMVALVIMLARFHERRVGLTLLLLMTACAALLRPNGLGAAIGVLLVIVMTLRRHRALIATSSLAAIASVVLLTPAFQTPGGDENTLAARTYEGLVIWIEPGRVVTSMPTPVDANDLSNVALAQYAVQHPAAMLNLAAQRVAWELIQVRHHYPVPVNLVIGTQMAVFYLLAAIGAHRMRGSSLNQAVLAVTLGLMLAIAATWSIAEGRFGWALLVTWSPWVGTGASVLASRVQLAQVDHPHGAEDTE